MRKGLLEGKEIIESRTFLSEVVHHKGAADTESFAYKVWNALYHLEYRNLIWDLEIFLKQKNTVAY